jgi:N-hydroxyarylamine O-acetyltransferase
MTVFDLDAYLARISFRGKRAPTLETLCELQQSHPRAIPFESLDVLLERPVSLELGAITQKLVHEHRGGYCFEQNLLFGAALRALGYPVEQLAARVQWNDNDPTSINARTHMLLRVHVAGQPYYCDVGFGGLQQTSPVRAVLELEQQTPHEPFRLVALAAGELQMQAKVKDSWRALYRFDLTPQHLVDYELANYWISQNPNSRFVKGLLAARVDEGRRYALHNNAFAVHEVGGETVRTLVTDALELRDLLQGTFQIRLPMAPTLDPLLERLVRLRPSVWPPALPFSR